MLAVLVMGAITVSPAEAKKSRAVRVATEHYMSPAPAATPIHPFGTSICNQDGAVEGNRGCVDFPVLSFKEAFVAIEVADATGQPAPAFLAWNEDPSTWIPFCGETKKPLKVRGGTATVWLYPYRSPNLPACPGSSTTGTVTATFLKHR